MPGVDQAYHDAINELQIAQHQFDQADADHIDIAVHRLQAARLKVDVTLKRVKGLIA